MGHVVFKFNQITLLLLVTQNNTGKTFNLLIAVIYLFLLVVFRNNIFADMYRKLDLGHKSRHMQ